ncbi:acyl dehydratase [Caldalkalibacillus uzonensis]|uniref:Acyl dehydratase n=1 Tax=Caldalkalibacillus uzonensis TaxID=353224 RepID=A0ABU0CWV3_9BACI|nr:MaoC/PaaZ C-terminal domain-containing protein [Caldalkalibacillus uzonensis]MDQ0340900.1 acyl dehydratase [Caldalkalibacillus uzonensis]
MTAGWTIGQKLAPITMPPVSRLELIKYAGASGDYNPIHTIDEEAEKAGLPGVIAHGMLTMAKMTSLFSPYFNEGYVKEFHTRFVGMVFVGDTITVGGEVKEKEETDQGDVYIFDIYARNQEGKDVATGQAKFLWYKTI